MQTLSPERPLTQTAIRSQLLLRIREEYLEMPGLQLTSAQARRLWGEDRATCDAAFANLIETKFLSCTDEGLFVLTTTRRSKQ